MKDSRIPPADARLTTVMGRIQMAESPEEKAFHFLRGIGQAFLSLRTGGLLMLPQELANPSADVREGIDRILLRESLSAFQARLDRGARRFQGEVIRFLDDESVDEAVVDELITARLIELDYAALKWLARDRQIPSLDHAGFLAEFLPRLGMYQEYLTQIPCPAPVARRLQEFSRLHGIQGSPLFPEWDDRPDIEKAEEAMAALRGEEPAHSLDEPTDFSLMPPEIRTWDKDFWNRDMLRRWPTEIAQEPDGAGKMVPIHLLPLAQPVAVGLAATTKPTAKALRPFYSVSAKTVPLKVEHKGVSAEGIWTIAAQTEEPTGVDDYSREGFWGRLSIYSRDGRFRLLAEAFSNNEAWELRVSIPQSDWMLRLLENVPPDQWENELKSRLEASPDDLFWWVLGAQPSLPDRADEKP